MEMMLVDIGYALITDVRGGASDGTQVLVIHFLTGDTLGDHCSMLLPQAIRLCRRMRKMFEFLELELELGIARSATPAEEVFEVPDHLRTPPHMAVARRVRVRNVSVAEPTRGPYDGTPFIVLHLLVTKTQERLTYAVHHETAAEFVASLATELKRNGCQVEE